MTPPPAVYLFVVVRLDGTSIAGIVGSPAEVPPPRFGDAWCYLATLYVDGVVRL